MGATRAKGYATARGMPIEHAWCVDARGQVVDPTWPADLPLPKEYWGAPFEISAVVAVRVRTTFEGVLFFIENQRNDLISQLSLVVLPLDRWPALEREGA